MTPSSEALIDAHASLAQEEIKEMSGKFQDYFRVKVGWMQRSTGQIRRFGTAKEHLKV